MTWRHAALYAGFGTIIVAALGASYLHLAAWLVPWMPPGWGHLSYVAALALDGMIFAPIMARQIVGGPVPGMALPLAQAVGVTASIYVNTRWGATTLADATAADVIAGASLMPLVALIMEYAMRATLAALQAREARQTEAMPAEPGPATVTRRPRLTAATAIVPPPAVAALAPQPVTAEALAAAEGVSLRTAYRRLAAARAGAVD